MDEKKMWGIHTSDDALFLGKNVIAIRFTDMGDLSLLEPTREAYKEKYKAVNPDHSIYQIANGAGQPYRFVQWVTVPKSLSVEGIAGLILRHIKTNFLHA